jgi:thiol:disulfide interchange protein
LKTLRFKSNQRILYSDYARSWTPVLSFFVLFFCTDDIWFYFLYSLDEETRQRQTLCDQLSTSTSAHAASLLELEELRLSLKASEDKGLCLQAELSKALDSNSVLQANAAASSLKIAELDNELLNLRVAVAEKLPLADRVLQLEKDAKVSALLIEEAKNAHEEALAQVVSLTAEKKVSLETLQLVQSEAEDRYNRTFKTKEEYISQVEAAESALEQTRQQLLQLQMTCNDMRSRIEEAKQNESQHMAAIRETAQKQVRHILPSCAVITRSNLISRH